jgi:hypothetical protein
MQGSCPTPAATKGRLAKARRSQVVRELRVMMPLPRFTRSKVKTRSSLLFRGLQPPRNQLRHLCPAVVAAKASTKRQVKWLKLRLLLSSFVHLSISVCKVLRATTRCRKTSYHFFSRPYLRRILEAGRASIHEPPFDEQYGQRRRRKPRAQVARAMGSQCVTRKASFAISKPFGLKGLNTSPGARCGSSQCRQYQ